MDFDAVPENVPWRCLVDAKAPWGETPEWSRERQSIFWINHNEPSLNETDPVSGATAKWMMPALIGGYALAPGSTTALVALEDGLYRLDLTSSHLEIAYPAPYDLTDLQFNDGRCDGRGRYWSSTFRKLNSNLPEGCGYLYRLDERGLSAEVDEVTIGNGVAFSPGGDTLYMSNETKWQIIAFDYDLETGTPSNRRVFAQLPEGWRPDGACVDTDGGYWSSMYAGGRIARFAPDGTLDRLLRSPVTNPTMLAFGGPDLSTMFLTTSRSFLDADALAKEPHAGGLFILESEYVGLEETPLGPWFDSD